MEAIPAIVRAEKFIAYEPNTGCWLWMGSCSGGYAKISTRGGRPPASVHVLMYENAVGPVPDGLELDHKCRVRCCVNPGHLEPVTRRVNVLRCGFRKINAVYLCGDPGGFPCGKLPLELRPCPLCDHLPAFTRGLQRITPTNFLHAANPCNRSDAECEKCPLGKALAQDLAGLCWVGERHYSPASFTAEAERLGVSKRVAKVPKWLELGKTWLFLAHPKVFGEPCPACGGTPTPLERAAQGKTNRPEDCEECEGEGVLWTAGVFHAFVPKRLVKILPHNSYPT